jgi:inorganic pyrophosphatase/exopolyphosphatase
LPGFLTFERTSSRKTYARFCDLDSTANDLAIKLQAKSAELAQLSAMELVTVDQKKFEYKAAGFKLGLAVIETTDDQAILDRTDEYAKTHFVLSFAPFCFYLEKKEQTYHADGT